MSMVVMLGVPAKSTSGKGSQKALEILSMARESEADQFGRDSKRLQTVHIMLSRVVSERDRVAGEGRWSLTFEIRR